MESEEMSFICKKLKYGFSSTESDQRKLHICTGFLLGLVSLGGGRLRKHRPVLKKQEPIQVREPSELQRDTAALPQTRPSIH